MRDSIDRVAIVAVLDMVFYIYRTGDVTAAKRLCALAAAQVEMADCGGEMAFAWSEVRAAGDHTAASPSEANVESSRSNAV